MHSSPGKFFHMAHKFSQNFELAIAIPLLACILCGQVSNQTIHNLVISNYQANWIGLPTHILQTDSVNAY